MCSSGQSGSVLLSIMLRGVMAEARGETPPLMSKIFKRVHEITGSPESTAVLEDDIARFMKSLVARKYGLSTREWAVAAVSDPEWGRKQLRDAQAAVERGCEMMQEYYRPSLERWATMTRSGNPSIANPAKYLLRADGLWDGATLLGKICVERTLSGKTLATESVLQEFEIRRKEHRIPDPPVLGPPLPPDRGLER